MCALHQTGERGNTSARTVLFAPSEMEAELPVPGLKQSSGLRWELHEDAEISIFLCFSVYPGCPETHTVDQADPELKEVSLPLAALGLKEVYAVTTTQQGRFILFISVHMLCKRDREHILGSWKGIGSTGVGVTGGCELPNVGAENQIPVL